MTLQQKIALGARILLGLVFFVAGLIGLLGLADFPAPNPRADKFIHALMDTGYLFKIVMGIETIGGVLLILGFFVPLVLLMLAPILVNIVLYQAILNPTPVGWLLSLGPLALEIGLAYVYRSAFVALFHIKPEPS